MFFVLSKLFWLVGAPSHWLGMLVLATAFCLLMRWMRAARAFGVTAALLLLLAGILPINSWMIRALEDRYPRPVWPAHVDGILILSPGFDTAILKERGVPAANAGDMRLVEGFGAARHYPTARVVFTGGSGVLGGAEYSEAETARYLFAELGLDPARLVLEPQSRNTYENILFSKALAKPKPGETWLLVTSAFHMPRAVAIARKLDWPMVAWPSDYMTGTQTPLPGFSIGANLALSDYAAHEWIGLLAYRLSGKAS
jgi:uncharacterized SAM-binding protein YcdF (DUF218 family)